MDGLGWLMGAVVAVLIVLVIGGTWLVKYLRALPSMDVARGWSMCPYCHGRIKPGTYTAIGDLGRGHWSCIE